MHAKSAEGEQQNCSSSVQTGLKAENENFTVRNEIICSTFRATLAFLSLQAFMIEIGQMHSRIQ